MVGLFIVHIGKSVVVSLAIPPTHTPIAKHLNISGVGYKYFRHPTQKIKAASCSELVFILVLWNA
ncbi:hypothetical protein FRX31_002919 [Thalictrum thalictroides]|uniref:Uncharacterized protein n=1 Tax=Thalictrum thalictroides TaxID=46969 RepID=A0A7J6XDE2_THATH|nr:hypothetical protein FRX31_002919 [Thalictrum thalictroides]